MEYNYEPSPDDVFFNPYDEGKKTTVEQSNERLISLRNEVLTYYHILSQQLQRNRTMPSLAEQGERMGRIFIDYVESSIDISLAINNARRIITGLASRHPEIADREKESNALLTGFLGEFAAGTMFLRLGAKPIKPTESADLYESTDLRVAAPKSGKEKEMRVQVKTLSLRKDRRELGSKAVPVLSSVHTLDNLNNFVAKLRGISEELYFVERSKNTEHVAPKDKILTINQDILDNPGLYQIIAKADPDITPINQHSSGSRIVKITRGAIQLHNSAQAPEHNFYPVMCVLGSPGSNGSDINANNGELMSQSLAVARQDYRQIVADIP